MAATSLPLRILCFGDSWTAGNAYGLKLAFGKQDVFVSHKEYSGTTAKFFATQPATLISAVQESQATHVLLSLGGNDFKNVYLERRQFVDPSLVLRDVEKSLRTILDALYTAHPNIHVIVYGYDFPGSLPPMFSQLGLSVSVVNMGALALGQSYLDLARHYTAKGMGMTYVPLWGTLQIEAAKKKGISLSGPIMSESSPSEFMTDMIHPNREGYAVLLKKLYEDYFAAVIDNAATATQ
eukprot:TRINITY_DN10776_c0_g1_i2.p1 TRINITY_DN10776_c0_g1~~TRINITY_DN10776_c0_g1_i2.p1  ORF type:complete len:263 (-),score=41.40 TRINITY_DN10776_c0_g1_i2:25-738(-)